MNRDYNTGTAEIDNAWFIGCEVEHTPAYGMRTLFVAGVHSADAIAERADDELCPHIYLGANMSFDVTEDTFEQWQPWETMATELLKRGFWVTLDVDVSRVEGLLEAGLCEYNQFIPMISVKIPYIEQLRYNACIKLDDRDFNSTNPGVWVHSVHRLMNRKYFTSWDKYKDDQLV